ncbi:MAG: hypothetical protein FWD93_01435 [Coriobacteriia bacterium]|nr:hypothetical protein [Coriobacteriia bacterium]
MRYKIVLIVVAIVGFFVCLTLHFYFFHDIDGLLINLAAVFLQILIAILLVDYLLDRDERVRWKGFEEKVQKKIIALANFTILEIRGMLGITFDQGTVTNIPALDSLEINKAIYSEIHGKGQDFTALMHDFTPEQWASLVKGLRLISSEVERTMLLYFSRLNPKQLELLSEMKEKIDLIILFPEVFPDIVGNLRQDTVTEKPNSPLIKEQIVQRTADRMRELLALSAELVKT